MKKIGYILIFLSNLIFIFYLWFDQSGAMLSMGSAPLFISLGRICGLVAVYLILWQLILIGRVKILEQTFGFDRLSAFHHLNGLLAWLFVFLHPLFLTLGYGLSAKNTFLAQLSSFISGPSELFPAFAALFFFFLDNNNFLGGNSKIFQVRGLVLYSPPYLFGHNFCFRPSTGNGRRFTEAAFFRLLDSFVYGSSSLAGLFPFFKAGLAFLAPSVYGRSLGKIE